MKVLGRVLGSFPKLLQTPFNQKFARTLVRKGGLEPPWVTPPDPKSGASANSATFASITYGRSPDLVAVLVALCLR